MFNGIVRNSGRGGQGGQEENSAAENEALDRMSKRLEDWVPGDYVKFRREMVEPGRINVYLKSVNITIDDFYKGFLPQQQPQQQRGRGGADVTTLATTSIDRNVHFPLPKISY
ncbi:aspartate kinase [Lasius niger]|uniref:Aspartate kinase n=1 Tax=Lasius niger TaxID=67767 RepID=A0A0J7K939_LASNI|nr:aspartate kinase [Lasius niger]